MIHGGITYTMDIKGGNYKLEIFLSGNWFSSIYQHTIDLIPLLGISFIQVFNGPCFKI